MTNIIGTSGTGGRGDQPKPGGPAPATPAPAEWFVERARGGAGTLHARGVPAVPFVRRTVEVLEVERPSLVLGSTQRESVADAEACRAAGVDIARRRSGGGAVLVDPAETLWVDVVIPAGDPLWIDDVSRSAHWLGRAWAAALREVAADVEPVVHEGSMCLSRWGRLVCFAGLGPGEVTDGAGGPKIVGISQRRTRDAARFQCAVPFGWDPHRIVGLLRFESEDERAAAGDDLVQANPVRPLDSSLREPLLAAFVAALPA